MKKIVLLISILLCIICAGVGFLTGRLTAPKPDEPEIPATTTFYATITEIYESSILVDGLAINDVNSRGAFDLTISESTVLEWRYTPLQFSELDVGDTVAVTYTGWILESYPAQIPNVLKIQLLDDEK